MLNSGHLEPRRWSTLRLNAASLLAAVMVFAGAGDRLSAEEILFIGNSFTYGGPDLVITSHGGVPKLVEAIAASKGKTISTTMISTGGKSLAWHLKQKATEVGLKAKPWDWVVLQEISTGATHTGHPEDFFQSGEEFRKLITQASPKTGIILYETWARPKSSEIYTGATTPKTFLDDRQMNSEIQKNYSELRDRLKIKDASGRFLVAPVGHAFALCREKYPEISLDWSDRHHASTAGSYLAALVIYSTIFQDSPKGATREFFGTSLDAAMTSHLQEIAEEVTLQKHP